MALLLGVVGVKLVSVGWYSNTGVTAFEQDRFQDAGAAFERLQVANVVEPWKAPFDLGDARAAVGDLAGAEAAFHSSLDLLPSRCETRFNLAATIEAIGDEAQGQVPAATVREHYARALAIAEGGDCAITRPVGERLAELAERLRDKLAGAADSSLVVSSPGDETDSDGQDRTVEGQSPSGNQQNLIEQRNQNGAVERRDRVESLTADEGAPDEPRW